MSSGPTLLIDADILAYRHAAAAQRVYKFDPEDEETWGVVVDPLDQVLIEFDEQVKVWMEKFEADHAVMAWSDSGNFRKIILPSYKSNRKDVAKPILLPEVREYGKKKWPCYQKPMLEGDDILGILATHPKLIKGHKIIISLDKDLKTIPGTIYNDGKDEVYQIDEDEANWWHYYQTLTGDPTDGYKGCPGIGPKRAAEILADCPEPWDYIVEAYEKKGLTEEDALVQARVARILRSCDYDFKRKEPILWQPPR
jgi:DNA polymerase I